MLIGRCFNRQAMKEWEATEAVRQAAFAEVTGDAPNGAPPHPCRIP
jgi:hypothetical protein